MFDAYKTRMIGLPYGETSWQYVKPFSYNTGTWRTDRRTELLYQYRVSICWRAIKRNIFNILRKVFYAAEIGADKRRGRSHDGQSKT